MRSSSCYGRNFLHPALAVLVVAALSRCAWEEARELTHRTVVLAQHSLKLPSPLQKPIHDCGHESGCICRGATQAMAVTVDQCQAQVVDLLPPLMNDLAASWLDDILASNLPWSNDDLFWNPPVSGRQLRALYASLVI